MIKLFLLNFVALTIIFQTVTQNFSNSYGPNGEGQLLWHYKPEDSQNVDWCQPAIVYNEKSGQRIIIFGDGDESGRGRLYAIDADTHKDIWGPLSFNGSIGNSASTLSADGRRVYFGEGSKLGKVYCIDTSTGNIIWIASGMPEDAGAFMPCAALHHNGRTLYIGSGAWPEDTGLADNRFYAINTATGDLKWIFESQTHPGEGESNAENYGSFFCDPAVLSDGRIVAATFSGYVYCLKDKNTHVELDWDFELFDQNAGRPDGRAYHQEIWGSPAIDSDGTIYIGSNAGKVHAIDPMDGKLKWESQRTGGEIFGTPVIGIHGEIYAGAEDHYLYVYQPPKQPTSTPVAPISRLRWGERWPNAGTVLADGEVVFGGEQGNRYIAIKLVDGKLVKQWESDAVGHAEEREAKTEPLIDPVTYTIYVSGGHSGGLYALKGSQAMANTPWPKVQRDIRNSGRAESVAD
jgi:outer membrane protein assembly factor BamB